jgi:hypothetical protein
VRGVDGSEALYRARRADGDDGAGRGEGDA